MFDQFTYLHFAVGIIAYYFRIPLLVWLILHTIFEVWENTDFGVAVIRKLPFWPGGKRTADDIINSVGDTIGGVLGWISGYIVDRVVTKGPARANWVWGIP